VQVNWQSVALGHRLLPQTEQTYMRLIVQYILSL
jgi:hypothetical protein